MTEAIMPRNKLLTSVAATKVAEEAAAKAVADAKAAAEAEAAAKAAADAAKATTVAPPGSLRDRVNAIVTVLEADEEFVTETSNFFAAGDIKLRGPCQYLMMLERDLSDDQLESLPIPGSTQKTSNNPDSYTDEIGGIKVRSSYYKDMARRLPGGREEQEVVNACDMFVRNDPITPDEYKVMTRQEINDLRKQADRRITNLASVLRKAIDLRNQMLLIEETLPDVECNLMFQKDKDGNAFLRTGPTPILIRDRNNQTDGEYISADTCLGYRVAYAKTQASPTNTQYKALKFSGGKTPSGTNNPGATPDSGMAKRVTTIAKCIEYMQELGAFFKNEANHKLILNQFSKEDSNAFVITYGDLSSDMDALFSGPTEERYKRLKIAQQEARNKREAEETAKKIADANAAVRK
jgi:hypothetical protein